MWMNIICIALVYFSMIMLCDYFWVRRLIEINKHTVHDRRKYRLQENAIIVRIEIYTDWQSKYAFE